MPIIITPNVPPAAAPGPATADIVLQAGSVISARVVQILGPDQVRIAIGGQPIDVLSQVALQAGQTLQLQVSQTESGIGLAIVNQQITLQPAGVGDQGSAAAATALASAALESIALAHDSPSLAAIAPSGTTAAGLQLTQLETIAVSIAAEAAATQQTSLAPLFADLGTAAGLPALPAQVQQAVAQVLSLRTNLDQNLTGSEIEQGFRASGLFLEASLASGSALASNATPDLKAALIVLRETLASSLANVTTAEASAAAPAGSATVPQVATASVGPQGAASAEALAPESTVLPEITTVATVQATAPAPVSLPQPALSALQPSAPGLDIVAGTETPVVVSPAIAPQPGATASRPTSPAQNPPLAIAQQILDPVSTVQILSSATTPTDPAARAAASSAALNLLQEALQQSPLAAGNAFNLVVENGQVLALIPALNGARKDAADDAEFARSKLPPPPLNGALPAAQPVSPATLTPHASLAATLQHLLADTDGAIARQTLLQVASLSGQTDAGATRLDSAIPRWNFEIPFATPQGTAIAQFEISRDDGGDTLERAKPVWRARFSLDVEPAGPIHALISLSGERTSVRMWAERSSTASQLRANVSQLSQALVRADLQPGDIVIRDGAPTRPTPAAAGHFLDRAL